MDSEVLSAFRETARQYARREVKPMVGTEGSDGRLDRLDRVLSGAGQAGLLAAGASETPDHEHCVWGIASRRSPRASLAVLEEVARECAGVATCLHAAGLGLFEARAGALPGPTGVALLSDDWLLDWDSIDSPPDGAVRLSSVGDGDCLRLDGEASFVLCAPPCRSVVVYAALDSNWHRVALSLDTPGVGARPVGGRCGLAALEVLHVTFDGVKVLGDRLLHPRTPRPYLRRLMLGLCAVALGNAWAALDGARSYAATRYQGGALIEQQPAVKLLLGESATKLAASAAFLNRASKDEGDDAEACWRAFAAKLRVVGDCCEVVTDCLQVLGGYGYMEDYRLEKRLRDALTLKSMAVRPDGLRRLCAERVGGEP
jgi:alkylation response protein AidB-like acyl-CoA dehydrogenase